MKVNTNFGPVSVRYENVRKLFDWTPTGVAEYVARVAALREVGRGRVGNCRYNAMTREGQTDWEVTITEKDGRVVRTVWVYVSPFEL